MIFHFIVKVKVLHVNNKVLGAWGQYHTVPTKFGGCEVRYWVGDWSVKYKFVSYHLEFHSVCIFLLGSNVTDYASICGLGALGEFLNVD